MMPSDGMHGRPPFPPGMYGGGPLMGAQFPPEQFPPEKSILYKTRLCRDWQQGRCRYGPGCKYAHGEQELRELSSEAAVLQEQLYGKKQQQQQQQGMPAQGPPPPPRPEGARRQYGVCDRFIATGSCAYGDRCKFSHDPSLRQGGGMGGGMGGGAMGGAMGGGGMGGGGMPPPPRPGGMMGQGGPGGQMDGPGMRPGMGMGGGPDGFMPGAQLPGPPGMMAGMSGAMGMQQQMQQQQAQQQQQQAQQQQRPGPPLPGPPRPPSQQPLPPPSAGIRPPPPSSSAAAAAAAAGGPLGRTGPSPPASGPPAKVEVTYVDRVRAVCGMLSIGGAAALSKDKPAALPFVVASIKSKSIFRENPYADGVEHFIQ